MNTAVKPDGVSQATSKWSNPLIVAILAASIAAIGSTTVALINGAYGRQVEAQGSEHARILEALKTGDPDKAATNLDFMLKAGLINDAKTRVALQKFLDNRKAGSGPALQTQPAQAFESPANFQLSELVFLRSYMQSLRDTPNAEIDRKTLDEVHQRIIEAEQKVYEDRRSKMQPGK